MAKDSGSNDVKGLEALRGRMTATLVLSVITIVFGALCVAFGIPTIVLSVSRPAYPFSSGSGLYSGILAILAGVFGILFLKEAEKQPSNKMKCLNITYRVFLSIGCDVGAFHFAYGIWALVVCSRGVNEAGCGGPNWVANYLLAAVNMSIGLIIMVVCIITYVVAWKVMQDTWKMAKVGNKTEMTDKTDDAKKNGTV